MKRVLLTGSSSHIGKWLIEELVKKYEVIGLARSGNDNRIKTMEFDFAEGKVPEVKDISVCIHLAALSDVKKCEENPELAFKTNVLGTLKILEFARKNKIEKFIYVSTAGVYGYGEKASSEEQDAKPFDTYTFTKYMSEMVCKYYSRFFPVSVLRYTFPYGPRTHPKRLVATLINRIKNGETIILNNDNKPILNPIFIKDLVKITINEMEKDMGFGKNFDILNVAGNEQVNIKEISEMIGDLLGTKAKFKESGKDTKDLIVDIKKLKERGYCLEYNMKEGLKETIKY